MTDRGNGEVDAELAALLGPRGSQGPKGPRGSEGSTHDPFAALPSDLDKALRRERGPLSALRSRPTGQRRLLATALVLACVAVVLVLTRRPDLGVMPIARLLLDVALLALPLTAALLFAFRPLHRPPPPRWTDAVLVIASATGLLVFASLPMAHADHPASRVGAGDDLVPLAIGCFAFGIAFGVLTLLGFRALSRGTGSLLAPTIAIAMGSALAGVLALYAHCPITHPIHLLLGHATVLLPFLGASLVVYRRTSNG